MSPAEHYTAAVAYALRKRLQSDALLQRAAVLMDEGKIIEAELILAQRDELMRGREWKREKRNE